MSPIEKIKQGILEKNWELVNQGYAILSGETLGDIDSDSESSNASKELPTLSAEEESLILNVAKSAPPPSDGGRPVKAKNPVFISSMKREKESAKNTSVAEQTDKPTRKPYQSDIRTCSHCKHTFDLNKIIRAGTDVVCPNIKCREVIG